MTRNVFFLLGPLGKKKGGFCISFVMMSYSGDWFSKKNTDVSKRMPLLGARFQLCSSTSCVPHRVKAFYNWSRLHYGKCTYQVRFTRPYIRLSLSGIGLYRENAIAVRVIDRSAYDATSRVHAHRQRKNLSYLRNGCCIYYLRPSGAAHL